MTESRERAVFYASVAFLWLFFFIQALHTPTLLDDWYQLTWHRHHPLGLSSIWEYAHYAYFNFNPRIGDLLLMLVNGPSWIHLVFTPLVQMAVLPLGFALAFGRWPRPTLKDLQLLLLMQVLIWLVTPIPGIVYFYRPFTTNYIWAFVVMMGLFIPYRLAMARADAGPRRLWAIPLMLVLGWLGGMSNEHTGPTAMVAMGAFLYFAYKKQRLRGWMIAGAVGLFIGYPMLFLAPGQALRYAGIATRNTPVYLLKTRLPDGMVEVGLEFIAEAQIAIDLFLVALLISYARARRRGETLAAVLKPQLVTIVALMACAGGMVATLFASPTVGERLLFAPAVLFIGALLILIDWLFVDTAARRFLVISCGIIFAYHVVRMIDVLNTGYHQNQARMKQLREAPPDTIPQVVPYGLWKRSRWWWGDDFQYASLREYIANEVYDLKNIEFDRHLHWAEPSPHDQFVATRTFDPPMTPEEDAQFKPRYVPTFWEWALVQWRRSMKLGPMKFAKGHRLVRYEVNMINSPFRDPKKRPIRVFLWTPEKLEFIDGRMFDDPNNQPYVRMWDKSVPPAATETWIEACGATIRTDALPDKFEHVGPLIPVTFQCRGTYTAFACEPDLCWFAGRYWR